MAKLTSFSLFTLVINLSIFFPFGKSWTLETFSFAFGAIKNHLSSPLHAIEVYPTMTQKCEKEMCVGLHSAVDIGVNKHGLHDPNARCCTVDVDM